MLCPNCKSENRDGAKFCDECGSPLTGVIDERPVKDSVSEGKPIERLRVSLDETQAIDAEQAKVISEQSEEPIGGVEDGPEAALEPIDDVVDDAPNKPEDDIGIEKPVEPETELIASDAGSDADETIAAAPIGAVTEMLADRDEELEKSEEARAPDEASHSPDLAGFDRPSEDFETERLISPGYKPPEVTYRDGGTMQMPRLETEEAPKSKEYRASNTAERKTNGKLIGGIVAAIVVIAAIAVFATYQMQLWGGKVVPDVTGMTEADARVTLSDHGFAVRTEKLKSDDTEGLVLIMDPAAGSRIDEGSEVVINIATTRTIPEIVGMSQEEAAEALANAGYERIKFVERSSDEARGTVLSVKPKQGSRAKSSTEVVVRIATPYVVPNVSGKYVGDAIAEIEAAGLGYEVVYYETDDIPDGTVVNTDPAAGVEVTKGTYVVLNTAQARGPVLENAAEEYLSPGNTVSINGGDYVIDTVQSVSYQGNNAVAYTVTARPYIYLLGEMLTPSSYETLSGTIVFGADNSVIALS